MQLKTVVSTWAVISFSSPFEMKKVSIQMLHKNNMSTSPVILFFRFNSGQRIYAITLSHVPLIISD
jgi:hypothetical protein